MTDNNFDFFFLLLILLICGVLRAKPRYNNEAHRINFDHLGLFNVHLNLSTRVFLHSHPSKCGRSGFFFFFLRDFDSSSRRARIFLLKISTFSSGGSHHVCKV